MTISTKLSSLKLRFAEEKDMGLVLKFIRELASYENLTHEVKATEECLKDAIFVRKIAEVIIGEYNNKPVAFALFYYSLSTFIGYPAIYIEDLYVLPKMRGTGIGTIMFSYLAKLAEERNCYGLEWSCLNWNEPSINFYKKMGAVQKSEWTMYKLHGKELKVLAERF